MAAKKKKFRGTACETNVGSITYSHRIHGTGIFTYIWAWVVLGINVGKFTLHVFFGIEKNVFLRFRFKKKVQVHTK